MLVEVDYRLVCKYLLYVDCVAMLVSDQLVYLKDLGRTGPNALSVDTAQVFLYSGSAVASVIYFYLVRAHSCLLLVFVVGMCGHLTCRLAFAPYFYLSLNAANLVAVGLTLYYLYVLWQQVPTRSTLLVPCWPGQPHHTHHTHSTHNKHKANKSFK